MKKYTAPEMEIRIFADCIKTDDPTGVSQTGTYAAAELNNYAFSDEVSAKRITTVRNIISFSTNSNP